MINCSVCGTQNRDGSKFCSNCGARLTPASGLVCAMCGTSNKVESVFCSKCGARLVPLTAAPEEDKPAAPPPIKGLSLPAKPTEALADEPAETPPPASNSTADWLSQLRAAAPTDEDESTVPPSAEVEELAEQANASADESVDWMARLRSTTGESAPIETPDEDIPDWLKPATPAETPSIEMEKPAWVDELKPPAPVDEAVASDDVTGVPDWLKAEQATEPPASAAPPAEPDWLRQPAIEQPAPVAESEIPEWLKEFKPKDETATEEPLIEALQESGEAQPTFDQLSASPEDEGIPDWLRTAAPAPQTEESIAASPAEMQVMLPESVPDWIAALKPSPAPAPTADEPVEMAGPLAGLRGVLPLALAVAEPHSPVKPAGTTAHKEGADLFASILSAPLPTNIAAAKKPGRAWTMRPLIYLLLALAVIVPFFIPFDLAGASLRTLGTPTEQVYEALNALAPNATVVMVFDYDPGTAWEMDLQARAIASHLARKNIKIIALSSLDTGATLAERILRPATNNAYGTRYINLGFLAGNEAGLASLASNGFAVLPRDFVQNQDPSKLAVMTNIKSLRDTQMVILLAGSDDTLRNWMEQVQPRAGTKFVAGVSAAVEPRARAYRDTPSKQLAAVMGGIIGAAQYEILSGQPGQAVTNLNVQTPVQLLFVAIIVLGNLVYWTQRARGTRGTTNG